VLEQLLCQSIPEPPPDVPPLPPSSAAAPTTQRERLELHTAAAPCSGCHAVINPPGFAFEHYGAAGEWRDSEGGARIDTRTALRGTADADGPIQDALDLALRLAGSDSLRACVTMQWFRYAMARAETADDDCALAMVRGTLAATRGNLREALVAFTQTDAFLQGGFAR
jgi:hypothetical protein